jgi:hypothetical protein
MVLGNMTPVGIFYDMPAPKLHFGNELQNERSGQHYLVLGSLAFTLRLDRVRWLKIRAESTYICRDKAVENII